MRKYLMSFAALAAMVLLAGCGNKAANTSEGGADEPAATDVAYETFTVEKYGVSFEIPQGMHRTDNPVMDNGACFSMVPEGSGDMAIDAAVDIGVYESMFVDNYTQEKVEEDFNESVPEDATAKQLGDMEYTYAVEGEYINEYHRVVFNGNRSINITVSYDDKYVDKLGGDVREHIFQSLKY